MTTSTPRTIHSVKEDIEVGKLVFSYYGFGIITESSLHYDDPSMQFIAVKSIIDDRIFFLRLNEVIVFNEELIEKILSDTMLSPVIYNSSNSRLICQDLLNRDVYAGSIILTYGNCNNYQTFYYGNVYFIDNYNILFHDTEKVVNTLSLSPTIVKIDPSTIDNILLKKLSQ